MVSLLQFRAGVPDGTGRSNNRLVARRLFAFNADTGAVAWEHDLVNTNLSTAPAIAGGVLYLPTHDGRLLALSEQNP